MANILVFGNGYLGSHLVEQLRVSGLHHVQVASRHGGGDCLEADLGSLESIRAVRDALGSSQPDWIVHCASSGRGGPDAYRSVFVEGVKNLVTVFPESGKILTSSTSVYPQIDGSLVTEESPANPDRDTGKYLREAEDILLANGGIVLRLAGIYGPGRSVHLEKMLNGTATIESGEVSRWLNQIHRDDAASAIIHLIETGLHRGEIFNVVDDHQMSQRECYESLAALLNRPVPGEAPPDKDRKRAWTHKQVGNAKIKATGWSPKFPSFVGAVQTDPRFRRL